MAPSTKSVRILAAGLLLAVARCQVSEQLAISAEHSHKQQELAAHGYRARAPNDDLHLSADYYSSHTNYKHQYQQQQQQQHDKQQQQQQRDRALDSGRAVINGNQATYVEPPADFKPIIYEPAAAAPSPPSDSGALAGELFDSSNQLASVRPYQHARYPQTDVDRQISAAGTSQQQAQGFKRAAGLAPSAANNQQDDKAAPVDEMTGGLALDSEQPALDANVLPLKPSIGRWSDWHDMSIEPDLAASDSQPEPVSASKLNWPPARTSRNGLDGLKTLYGLAADMNAIKQPGAINANALNRQHQQQQQQKSAASESQRVHRQFNWPQAAAGPLRVVPLNVEERRNEHFHAANLISFQQEPAAVQYASAAPHWHQYQLEAGHDYRRPSPLMSSLQTARQHEQPQQQPPPQQQKPPFYLVSPAMVQAPPSPMHFLMAHNQQFRPMQRSHFAAAEQQLDNLFIQRRRADAQPARSAGSKLFLAAPAVRQNAEVRLIQSAVGRVSTDGGAQVSAPLMSPKEAPRVFSLADRTLPAAKPPAPGQVNGSAGLANKLAGANNSSRSGLAANSTLAAAAGKPRVLKRRRIKTQLPVGLSSWMLGGIRDLDARHWKLPADVLSKLAVNDVDLAHPAEQPALSGAAFAGFDDSAATTDLQAPSAASSALERAGPPLASSGGGGSSTQRVPSGGQQQIPR